MSERVIDVAARAAYERWRGPRVAGSWESLSESIRVTWRRTVLAVAEVLDREIDPPEYVSMTEVLERNLREL